MKIMRKRFGQNNFLMHTNFLLMIKIILIYCPEKVFTLINI